MMNEDDFRVLAARYLAGEVSEAEAKSLSEHLRNDADARRWLRDASLHATIIAERANVRGRVVEARPARGGRRNEVAWIGWSLAACFALLGLAHFFLWSSGEPVRAAEIVTLQNINGAVSWSGGGGEQRSGLENGVTLGAGTLTATGDGASAQIRFGDGTLVILNGDCEVTFSEEGQKRILLRRGVFTAEVKPQMVPMIVRTQLAELEVLGTVFAVSSEKAETALNVEKGRVRFRRLVDGKSVEVTDAQRVTATLNPNVAMVPVAPVACPTSWGRKFDTRPPSSYSGEWSPLGGDGAGVFRATPYLAATMANGTPIVHHGIGIQGGAGGPLWRGFVTVEAQSVIKVRLRTRKAAVVKVFMTCKQPSGTYAGNFEGQIVAQSEWHEGWQDVVWPLAAIAPISNYPQSPGIRVAYMRIHTANIEAGLEVESVAIEPAP